jgi:hypothetical protein
VEEHFKKNDEEVLDKRKLFNLCSYYENDDGEYGFSMEDACKSMVAAFDEIIGREKIDFPNAVRKSYIAIRDKHISQIDDWIRTLCHLKPKYKPSLEDIMATVTSPYLRHSIEWAIKHQEVLEETYKGVLEAKYKGDHYGK